MRRTIVFALLVPLVGIHAGDRPDPDGERSPGISREQFYIGGATLGEGEVQGLLDAFGEPLEVRSEETEAGPDTAKTYVFDGVEAYTEGDEVLNIECTIPAYETPDSARVGDPVRRIFEIYGATESANTAVGEILGYPVGDTDAILMFHIDGERVTKIELWFHYT
jgi:hypothetical protein